MHFRTCLLFVILLFTPASNAHSQSSFVDLSKPMSGKSQYVFHSDGTPVEFGVPLIDSEPGIDPRGGVSGAGGLARSACGGPDYGATSCVTGQPKLQHVRSYVRRDGVFVGAHYRSARRR